MRRKVSAFFGVALAMLLSVVLATPASANTGWVPGPEKIPAEVRYKYGYDYYKKSFGNGLSWSNQGISNQLNPAAGKAPTVSNSARPLSGKIIEPGKTVVRAPVTYRPSPSFLAAGSPLSKLLAGGKLLGMAGVGIGGTAQAPSNAASLYAAQGVSAGCQPANKLAGCSRDDITKIMTVNSCEITGKCAEIGATFDGGSKTEVSPIPADLWAKLSGQKTPAQQEASEYLPDNLLNRVFTPITGCEVSVPGLEQLKPQVGSTNQALKWHFENRVIKPGGPFIAEWQRIEWENECGPQRIASADTPGQYAAQCVSPASGKAFNATGQSMTSTGALNRSSTAQIDPATFGFKSDVKLCGPYATPDAVVLKIIWYNSQTKDFNTSNRSLSYMKPGVWFNPNPDLSLEEDLQITTTVDCQTPPPDSFTYTYSTTVKSTAAFALPSCPAGTELVRHDVKSQIGTGAYAGQPTTLDAGAAVPAEAAKYPDCAGGSGGCVMSVVLDGAPCVVGKPECETWPQVAAKQPSRVGCAWGPYTLPGSNCNVLSNAYRTETGVVFDPRSGEWVAVDTNGSPAPVANPAPWNPTNPNPVPGQVPGTTTPTTGTNTGGFPATGTNPSDSCVPGNWGWNPVEWVKRPVVCALQDAFVPKMDVKARSDALALSARSVVPISWISTPIAGPSGGGCPNWVVNVGGLSRNVVCESSFTQAIVASRGPMFGIVASAMVWPLLRSIWYALIPVLRVTPSGGSK